MSDEVAGIVAIVMLVAIIWIAKGLGMLFKRWLAETYCVFGAALVAGLIGGGAGLGLVWFSNLPDRMGSLLTTAFAYGFVAAFQAGATAFGSSSMWSVTSGDD